TTTTGYEGSTIAFGRRRTCRSITTSATPIAAKYRYAGAALSRPRLDRRSVTATNNSDVANSTSGYHTAIGRPHPKHRPRRTTQLTTGMLCDGLIGVPHDGHRDPGRSSESPRGTR